MPTKPTSAKLTKLTKLRPHPDNYRRHSEAQLEQLCASIENAGFYRNIVACKDGTILAGHGAVLAAERLGMTDVPVVFIDAEPTSREALKVLVGDNWISNLAQDDEAALAATLKSLEADDALEGTGFSAEDLEALRDAVAATDAEPVELVRDEVPEAPEEPTTKVGDLWILGRHRLLCGDSTDFEHVNRLFGQDTAMLVHADPPYGMGKEKDGVANDNLYREKLDAFQMDWWRAWRPRLADNASAYIWGNAPDLWRLWYVGGLSEFERMTMRNEIVWWKGDPTTFKVVGMGQATSAGRAYADLSERCLFFMLGEQGFNTNADNYWEGWEPIRSYLAGEMERCGWTPADLNRITGTQMAGHWVSRSQWVFITEGNYLKIQEAAREHDAFKREHDELKREHDELKREHDELKREFYATRAPFDNTHDNMTDVWPFPVVTGEDRHGHATPKPVEMIARALKSSSREGDLVAVPFGGTCPEIIAAEQLGRSVRVMELSPVYCDVIVRRWENLTGGKAELA